MVTVVTSFVLLWFGALPAQAQDIRPSLQLPDPRTVAREKAYEPKVVGPLRRILPPSGLAGPVSRDSTPFALERDGLIPVTVHTSAPGEALALLASLGRPTAHVIENVIEVYVAPSDLGPLAALGSVQRVEAITPPRRLVTSQGRTVHNAGAWIAGGTTGSGVKVGVIDSFGRISQAISLGELPTPIAQRCYTAAGVYSTSLSTCNASADDHGTAVAESLVDIAPGVQLYLGDPVSQGDMRSVVDWMVSQGVKVINYSAAYTWDGPGDGTSPFATSPLKTVDAAVAGGAVFTVSAGNYARSTYYGAFADADGDGFVNFASSSNLEVLRLSLSAGQVVTVQLRWGTDSWTAASKDLDLYLLSGSTIVAASEDVQSGTSGQFPFELLDYTASSSGTYWIAVKRYAGAAPTGIQVQAWGADFVSGDATPGGSINNPAETANAGALTVGAANWQTPTTIEPFSALGPTPDGRVKPDIVGVDRADTWAYGPNGFPGTSQSAPHVAGLAALVAARFPAYTPQQVVSYLKANAQPRGAVPNNTWGAGLARLPDGCSYALSTSSLTFTAAGGSASINLTTATGCTWTVASGAGWLTPSPSSGTGSGTVTLTAAPNATGSSRTATATVAGQAVSVTQAAGAGGTPTMAVSSSAFAYGAAIPQTYLCGPNGGTGQSFPLTFANIPAGTVSLAVNINDPDVPLAYGGPSFDHWTRWNLSPSVGGFSAGGMTGGTNTAGSGYFPPCPPPGTGVHRYIVTLYAVDTTLAGTYGSKAALEAALSGHVLASATTVGLAGTPSLTVSPTSWAAPSAGGTQVVTVSASSGSTAWSASSNQAWLTLSAASGTGSGSVTLTAAANGTASSRTATVLIGGRAIAVTQEAGSGGGGGGGGTGAPAPPSAFQASASSGAIALSWQAGAGGGAPADHEVQATTDSDPAFAAPIFGPASLGTAGTSAVLPVPPGITGTYRVRVRATNASGASVWSAGQAVTLGGGGGVTVPGTPTGVSASVTGTLLTVTWSPVTSATSYVVEFRQSLDGAPVATVPVASPPLALPLPPGVTGTYFAQVRAANGAGQGPASNAVSFTIAGQTLPGAPTLAPATVSGNSLTLSWTPGSGGAPASYLLTASLTPGGAAIATVSLSGTTATFQNVPLGLYYLRLQAVNSAGTSPPSNTVSAAVQGDCYYSPCNGVPVYVGTQPAGDGVPLRFVVGEGVTRLTIQTYGGRGDADLYVRRGASATLSAYDCASRGYTNSETCTFTNPAPGIYYIWVYGFTTFFDVYALVTTTGGS